MKLTGLKGRIPVEPLDDERLTNIERRIVTGAADAAARGAGVGAGMSWARPRFGLAMALGIAAVVAIGAGFAGWQLRGDGGGRSVVAAEPVHVNTTGDRAVLDIGDARILSDASTDFTVTRPDGGVLVTMKRGKVELQVDKRGNRAPLVVAAGDTNVVVVGTRFSVDYGDGTSGVVDVRVTEGVVKVERHQQEVRVAAGQAWTTSRGVIALADLPDGTQIASAKVTGANGGASGGANGGNAGGANGANGDGANGANGDANGDGANGANGDGANGGGVNGDGVNGANGANGSVPGHNIEIETNAKQNLRDHESSVPTAKIPTNGAQTGSAGSKKTPVGPEVTRQILKSSGGAGGGSAATDLRRDVLAVSILPAVEISGKRPEETISELRMRTAKTTGAEAAMALYSIAVLQHFKLGRSGDALQTLDQYTRRFAGTEFKETFHAALWLRVRILCAKTVDDRCRQAAYTHMHQATGTPAAKVSELLTLAPR